MQPLFQKVKSSLSHENLPITIIVSFGFILRFRQYLTGRSLWEDEAMLALNIVNRNFIGLFKPLDFNQGAPIGFLLVERFFNTILGRNELVLRFFPFIAGTASLWLFYLLLKRITNQTGLLIALALFAINPQLVYYTSETKQYIVDVTVCIGLLVLAFLLFEGQISKKNVLWLGLVGVLGLWLSHPALFVLAGIGLTLLIINIGKRDVSNLRLIMGIGVLWLANLGLLYFINLRNLSQSQYLLNYWSGAFIPMPPWSNLSWIPSSFNDTVTVWYGMPHLALLVFPLIVFGWLVLFRESRGLATALAFILVVVSFASALRLYPAHGRLALFLLPNAFILIGKAVETLQKILTTRKLTSTIGTLVLSAVLLYSPFVTSTKYLIAPKYFEHIRPYMDYLAASWKPGDVLFVSYWTEPAFQFYAPFYKLENVQYETSQFTDYPDLQKLETRFDPLIGHKRVWVLFSHVYEQANFNERDALVAYLNQIGTEKREFHGFNTSVYLYLYDLKK